MKGFTEEHSTLTLKRLGLSFCPAPLYNRNLFFFLIKWNLKCTTQELFFDTFPLKRYLKGWVVLIFWWLSFLCTILLYSKASKYIHVCCVSSGCIILFEIFCWRLELSWQFAIIDFSIFGLPSAKLTAGNFEMYTTLPNLFTSKHKNQDK